MSNPLVHEIEEQAGIIGVSINELCRLAGIARSTFTRLKSGDTENGNMGTILKLKGVLSDLSESNPKKPKR